MRTKILPTLSVSLLGVALAAQNYTGEGPGIVIAPALNSALGATGLGNGVTQVAQILLTPHSSLPANSYYLVATVQKGAGNYDILSGVFNGTTNAFTINTDVDQFNTTADEFAGTVDNSLRFFALDTSGTTACQIATRAGTTGQWSKASALNITGAPIGYNDSMLCTIGNQLSYFHISGVNLMVGDINPATGVVNNVRALLTNPRGAGCHSPSPITDANGVARALIFSMRPQSSDAYFAPVLDDSAPAFEIMDRNTWLANPDANGGSLNWAEAVSSYTDPVSVGITGMSGASVSGNGGPVNLTVFAPLKAAAAPPYLGTVVIGFLGTAGIPIPGIGGKPFGLDPTKPMIFLPSLPVGQLTGTASYNLTVPALGPNVRIDAQSVILDPIAGQAFIGNTASIRTL
jgi:hypothetical protein